MLSLNNEPGPKMILEALKEFGTIETPGKVSNQKIIGWAAEVNANLANVYLSDDIPWCGFFMAVVAIRAGKQPVTDPLWALNCGTFGVHSPEPMRRAMYWYLPAPQAMAKRQGT